MVRRYGADGTTALIINGDHPMLKPIVVASALLAIVPLAANAGEVQNRLHRENQRINQGVANGSLTYGEYRRLDRSSDRITAQRNRDLKANGGTLTAAERARLNREQNRLSDRISFDKHNAPDQPGH
jgi:hypothetical protein